MADPARKMPPKLPDRNPSTISTIGSDWDASPPYSAVETKGQFLSPLPSTQHSRPSTPTQIHASPYSGGLDDPRASSTQSLRPVESVQGRRTLLVIYIHGFLGNETSFQSFPANVHGLLTTSLAESHVVYTKIYPRYKSRKKISFARDDFSQWITPHESSMTDVVLVGHSLGGILAAEVALLESYTPERNELFQHRILGVLGVDTPFLGMHPGVVGTGIASLFRGAPPEPESSVSSTSFSDAFAQTPDANYNPAYTNDVHLANRKGKLQRAWYFWNKHAGELTKATGNYFQSHLEFGGCLADYPGLRKRYNAIRSLEDVDEIQRPRAQNGKLLRRVRFVNYYSASTGRVKEREPSPDASNEVPAPSSPHSSQPADPADPSTVEAESSLLSPPSPCPRISLEESRGDELITKQLDALAIEPESAPLNTETRSTASEKEEPSPSDGVTSVDTQEDLCFPPLSPLPEKPPDFDPSLYQSPDTLELAKKEHARTVKTHERAVKERQMIIRDREKLVEKRQRDVSKAKAKAEKLIKQKEARLEKEKLKSAATLNTEDFDRHLQNEAEAVQSNTQPMKKQKDRKFCSLPSKDARSGKRDPTWIRVYMEGIDEVVAHTSMFKPGEPYARLVADTAERIEQWVKDDMTTRMVMEELSAQAA